MKTSDLKRKLLEQGITYQMISKATGIKGWKIKHFFSDRKLSDEDTIQVLTSIHQAITAKKKLHATINRKRKKILSHKF